MSAKDVYVALPTAKSPRLYLKLKDVVDLENSIEIYQPHSLKGKVLKFFIRMAAKSGIVQRLKIFHLSSDESSELDSYSKKILELLGVEAAEIVFLKGTPGPHQKWTARIAIEGKLFGFVKIATTKEAVSQVQTELDALTRIKNFSFNDVQIPVVLASQYTDDLLMIGLSPPGEVFRPLDDSLDVNVLTAFVVKLFNYGKDDNSVEGYIDSVVDVDESQKLMLLKKQFLDWSATVFPNETYLSGYAHGDLVPWNIFSMETGDVFVFDWEYLREDAPALFDVFHYIFMQAMLLEILAPAAAIEKCLADGSSSVLPRKVADALGISTQQMPAYLGLYLFGLLGRFCSGQKSNDCILNNKNSNIWYVIEALDAVGFGYGNSDRRKVLVSAYACDPEHGSEPGVGWNMVKAISEYSDVWLITKNNNCESIEQELLKQNNNHIRAYGLDLPLWLGWWKRGQSGVRTYYYLWQYVAAYTYWKKLKSVKFDLGHHVTFVNDWLWSFLALTPLPFIWGPIGSCPPVPHIVALDQRVWLKDRIRYLFQGVVRGIDPMFWISAIRARRIIGITDEVVEKFPLFFFRNKFEVFPAIGVESLPLQLNSNGEKIECRVVSVGNFVPIKHFHLVLMSFALVKQKISNATLTIVGKGRLEKQLIELADSLGLSESVEFCQWMPRTEVLDLIGKADVFLYPSAEASGMVVLEAMVQGTPVVCLDYAGPAALVGDSKVLKVPVEVSREHVVNILADRVLSLLESREVLLRYGRIMRCRAIRKYSWSRRGNAVRGWYRDVLLSKQ